MNELFALKEAKEEIQSIQYDLACVIVPRLISDEKIRTRLRDTLSMLNGLQDRLSKVVSAIEEGGKGEG